jgi:hypothetical protein
MHWHWHERIHIRLSEMRPNALQMASIGGHDVLVNLMVRESSDQHAAKSTSFFSGMILTCVQKLNSYLIFL